MSLRKEGVKACLLLSRSPILIPREDEHMASYFEHQKRVSAAVNRHQDIGFYYRVGSQSRTQAEAERDNWSLRTKEEDILSADELAERNKADNDIKLGLERCKTRTLYAIQSSKSGHSLPQTACESDESLSQAAYRAFEELPGSGGKGRSDVWLVTAKPIAHLNKAYILRGVISAGTVQDPKSQIEWWTKQEIESRLENGPQLSHLLDQ